jgi:branched-chain amino acid transport system permease protein
MEDSPNRCETCIIFYRAKFCNGFDVMERVMNHSLEYLAGGLQSSYVSLVGTSWGATGDLVVGALSLGALYALISTAFSLSFNIGRFFDLSLGVSFLASGYTAYALTTLTALPLPATMILGVLAGGAVGTATGLWLIVPLSRRVTPLPLFVATLAILYLAQALAGILFGEGANVLRQGSSPTIVIGSLHITDIEGAQVVVALSAIAVLLVLIHKTRWGRYARAIADDPDLAVRYGIPVSATLFRCYVLAGVFAGIAGSFYAAGRTLEPTQAMIALLAAMVATIIGGESVGGAVLGAIILGALETFFGFVLSGNWKATVAFTVLLIFLTVRGGGAVVGINRRL